MKEPRGVWAVLIGAFLAVGAVFFFFRFLVAYALYDLHDLFREGSLMWGMVHTNFWILFWLLGALVGTLHKWWKEEDIYLGGLEELRLWRSR